MITPRRLLILLRLAFVMGAALMAVLMFGPYQGLERSLGLNDTAAHALAFYLATLGLFLVAPGQRRDDLILFPIAAALAVEILQPLAGRSLSISDFLAGLGGVIAAYLPGRIEWIRQLARHYPNTPYPEIRARDRRRMAGTIAAPSPGRMRRQPDPAPRNP